MKTKLIRCLSIVFIILFWTWVDLHQDWPISMRVPWIGAMSIMSINILRKKIFSDKSEEEIEKIRINTWIAWFICIIWMLTSLIIHINSES